MKQTTRYLLLSIIFSALLSSCSDFVHKESFSSGEKMHPSIDGVLERQRDCALASSEHLCNNPPLNCSMEAYCSNDACRAKLACCHSISREEFNDFTKDRTTSSKSYTAMAVKNKIENADCDKHAFRIRRWLFWIRMSIVDRDEISSTGGTRSYYSISTIKGILESLPQDELEHIRFVFYKGWKENDAGQQVYFMPFEVTLGPRVLGYYDISDSFP